MCNWLFVCKALGRQKKSDFFGARPKKVSTAGFSAQVEKNGQFDRRKAV
jgi:hypothetical protein